MQDLWCLVTPLFLLFISSDGRNSPLGRPLRVAVEEPWAVVILFPGGNKQQQSNFHVTKIVWLFSCKKKREKKSRYILCVCLFAHHTKMCKLLSEENLAMR